MNNLIIQTYGLSQIRGTTLRHKAASLFDNVIPNAPFQGPPIPAGLGVCWSGNVRGKMPGIIVRSSIRGYSQITDAASDLIAGNKPYLSMTLLNPLDWLKK